MDEYIPATVYANLVRMFDYRRVVAAPAPLERDAVVQKLNHYEFVTLTGHRTHDANDPRGAADVTVVLIAPGSKIGAKSADFKKMMRSLPAPTAGVVRNLVFVSELGFTIHIKKFLYTTHRATNPTDIVEDYSYKPFLIEVPKHVLVSEHVIATEAEVDEHCARYYRVREDFPKLIVTDPMAVWIGARAGMCVRCVRASESAMQATVYRLCVKS